MPMRTLLSSLVLPLRPWRRRAHRRERGGTGGGDVEDDGREGEALWLIGHVWRDERGDGLSF